MYLLFFLVWIVFNGKITPEIIFLGLLISGAVFWFVCRFMDYNLEREKRFYGKLVMYLRYAGVLITEIVKANVSVIHLILTGREKIEPVIIKFRTTLKSETSKVALANSITLTPGTITISLEGDEYTVHCLDKSLAEGIEDSIFVQLLHEIEEAKYAGEEEKEDSKWN